MSALPYGDYGTSPTTLNGRDTCPICKGALGGYEEHEGVLTWVDCDCTRTEIACPCCHGDGDVLVGDTRYPCSRCAVEREPDWEDGR